MKNLKSPDSKTNLILRFITIWRWVFVLLVTGCLVFLWMPTSPVKEFWQKLLLTVVLSFTAILSAYAATRIPKRDHRGRMISLLLDYLAFVTAFVLTLNIGQVFIGIDSLAEKFGSGLPFIGIILVGYLIGAVENLPLRFLSSKHTLHIFSRYTMLAGFALFLWRVDILTGFVGLIKNLSQPEGLSVLVGMILFGLALWAMWREKSAAAMGAKTNHEQVINGWLFLSPNLLGFLIFFAGPLLLSFYFSFTDSDAFNPPNWVGFANYARILNIRFALLASPDQLARDVIDIKVYDEVGRIVIGKFGLLFAAADKFFWLALRNTLTFALFAVPISVIPALILANILNSKLPGMKFFRAIYFIPSIAAIVGISLVWQWLYNATIGFINSFITVGIEFWNNLFNTAIIDPRIQWVSDEKTALLSIIILAAWQTMGFNTVLFLAGLQNIPGELYEAATVDGAGAWNKFWNITIPMLAPSTFYVITTTTIQSMQVFEQVFILMNPPEGPNNSTITLVLYLYRSGFQNFKQGYASAIAWVLFIVIFGLTLIQFIRQRRSSIYDT